MMSARLPPVIGFSAYSGTGKTTLLKKIIVLLRQRDIRLAVIKHAHHDFEIDHPGKDSFELHKAGAYQMLISSARRKALITEFEPYQAEPTVHELINDLDHANIDLILVEGFKREHFAKIELHRAALNKPYLFQNDQDIIALASDHELKLETDLQLLDLNQPEMIADFIYRLVFPV
jgi:molybdopterin-guanine dinucleotide biosynthesis protein MobB